MVWIRLTGADEGEEILPTLKVSWKAKKSDPTNGGYSQEILEEILNKVNYYILISFVDHLRIFFNQSFCCFCIVSCTR